ncbi:Protein archease [Candidatus Tiddalikarchaeum anstoanum]|nr:Protein archease [Candidatus Tiddalikarchaeum anstoanum]
MNYEYLDTSTADLTIRAFGKDLKEAFTNSAMAVFNTMVDAGSVSEQEIKLVSKKAKDIKSLFYDFIEEIIYFHDAEGLVFKTVKVEDIDEKNNTLRAVFKGENFNPKKHKPKNNIKAITYYDMKISHKNSGFEIEFTLDL